MENPEVEDLRAQLLSQLLILSKDSEKLNHLAGIEQEIVKHVVDNSPALSCTTCVRWMQRLLDKAERLAGTKS